MSCVGYPPALNSHKGSGGRGPLGRIVVDFGRGLSPPSCSPMPLVPKLCLGTQLRETPVSRRRGHFHAVRETEFRGRAFPNRVWERGFRTSGPKKARTEP